MNGIPRQEYPFTIAVLSGKGGVGKTTISLNLAKSLSQRYKVWLIDLDLHNRGATSIAWESEDQIPVSVAQLILETMELRQQESAASAAIDGSGILELYLDQVRDEEGKPPLSTEVEEKLLKRVVSYLGGHRQRMSFSNSFFFLAAAKAGEGRLASHLLWKFEQDWKATASAFLPVLLRACGEVTPGSIVVLDGHGSLDDLTIAAAGAANLTYIINEPDLATFSGSLTLFREIYETHQDSDHDPRIEFIINRVPPGKSLLKMEADFGVLLRALSPTPRAIAAYFPLESELFGVFGSDPFVSDIFTRYWFSRKIDLISTEIVEYGVACEKLPPPAHALDTPSSGRARERIRFGLKREFHKRGDLLLILWLALVVAVEGHLTFQTLAVWGQGTTSTPWPLRIAMVAGLFLLVETVRWFMVQRQHLKNARVLREVRKLHIEQSESTRKADILETRSRRAVLSRRWKIGFAFASAVTLFAAFTMANLLGGLHSAKNKRAISDIGNVGVAWMSWWIDQMEARDQAGEVRFRRDGLRFEKVTHAQLVEMLRPDSSFFYMSDVPKFDPWGTPYEFRMSPYPRKSEVLIICSSGLDGKGRCAETLAHPVFTDWDHPIAEGGTWKTEVVEGLFPPEAIVWADGYFVRAPGLGE